MNRKNSKQQDGDDDQDRKPAAQPSASQPEWRSVSMMPPASAVGSSIPRPMSLGGAAFRSANPDVIDKASFFTAATQPKLKAPPATPTKGAGEIQSNWSPRQLRPVPAFYPLERSSRFVEDDLTVVVSRVSEANRLLSIHAIYCDETATASLLTAENVEMQLSLWKTSGKHDGIVVEIQRRNGDSLVFHRYSRAILDAAVGELDIYEHIEQNGADLDVVYSKKVQRLLSLDTSEDGGSETENAIIAIEIAHGLLMKDRMDARQLGLESLCLLTDPKKTGITTALIASRVVLLGTAQDADSPSPEEGLMFDETPFQEIRQTILSLIQLRRIGEADEFEAQEAETDEEEHITILHNLALAVLANALDAIENEDNYDDSAPEDVPVRGRTETCESISERFLEDAKEISEDREILKTLISELGKANAKPHNACLSAKCIGSLCRASDKARSRAKELGAKTVVQTALDVGTRTHLKLEKECDKVLKTLNNTQNEN
ncbi:hypothetical protein IV203_033059 [Nitzschia inconspicua]|uniref:Uncharacterized protein n=1 Tax=Nitzschia inconspicua TaxID=303405 RepID=A0A9K3KMG8_9STRA|nr:hypothetical protein IV203_033059 [Nitzschia inconspicua]